MDVVKNKVSPISLDNKDYQNLFAKGPDIIGNSQKRGARIKIIAPDLKKKIVVAVNVEVLYIKEDLKKGLINAAEGIIKSWQGEKIALIGVKQGGTLFRDDLKNKILKLNSKISIFTRDIKICSYHGNKKQPPIIEEWFGKYLSEDCRKILVDEIVTSGETVATALSRLGSAETCIFFNTPKGRKNAKIDHSGIICPIDGFFYGLYLDLYDWLRGEYWIGRQIGDIQSV